MTFFPSPYRAVHRGSNPSIFDGPLENWGPRGGPRRLLGTQRSAECKKKTEKGKERKKRKERKKKGKKEKRKEKKDEIK